MNTFNRDCRCVIEGECGIADMTFGRSEVRNFQCVWQDKIVGRAICNWDHRFFSAEPDRPDEPWHHSSVTLRHVTGKGWCLLE